MNIIILGPQGSGKGTQAKLLVEKFGFYHFEMGGFLREVAKTNPVVAEIMNEKGKLVPDEIFTEAMKKLLGEKITSNQSLLLDGFPRNVSQYKIVKNWLDSYGKKIDLAIVIEIGKKETVKRLSGRRLCQKCGKIWSLTASPVPPSPTKCECGGKLFQREDDKPKAIEKRLEQYNLVTKPVLKILEKEGLLVRVNGERPIEEIFADIAKIVEGFKKK